jgi:hypothetical protein
MVVVLLGLLAAPAAAETEPLPPGTVVLPGDGQVWTASAWPSATPFEMHEFAVYALDYEELPDRFVFAVAASPATDADGLLADPVDRYVATAQADRPGIYAAPTDLGARWLGTPGTYAWQASYLDDDGDTYASPVRTLSVVAPPPPDAPSRPVLVPPPVAPLPVATPRAPDAGTVRTAVRRAIHAATHMVPRGLVYRCVPTPAAATCRPSWRDVRFRYRGTLRLSFAASPIAATFTGTRVARGHRRARAVTWATSL